MLNTGLLTPQEVIRKTLTFAQKHDTPLNSLEGFIRQILGWREFMRGVYVSIGGKQRTSNFWKHQRRLPESFWTANTGIDPLDDVIRKALKNAYSHHIERLMIVGNFMVLTEIHPDDAIIAERQCRRANAPATVGAAAILLIGRVVKGAP